MLPRQAPVAARPPRLAARPLTVAADISLRTGAALAGALALLLAAGCGGEDGGPAQGPAPAPASGEAALTVTLQPRGPDGPSRTAELICPPDSPGQEDACAALDGIEPDAADPVPPGTACAQVYGGPDVVRIEGTLHGSDIDARLSRENSCEIDRFERFQPLLDELFPNYSPGQAL